MDNAADLAKLSLWLASEDFAERAAAADGLAVRHPKESVPMLQARLREETDEWVFVAMLGCLVETGLPEAQRAVEAVAAALTDPYLRFVCLNFCMCNAVQLSGAILANYIEDGPWFVRLSAVALVREVGKVDLAELVVGIIQEIERNGVGTPKEGIRTCEADRILYDRDFALSFARALLTPQAGHAG